MRVFVAALLFALVCLAALVAAEDLRVDTTEKPNDCSRMSKRGDTLAVS